MPKKRKNRQTDDLQDDNIFGDTMEVPQHLGEPDDNHDLVGDDDDPDDDIDDTRQELADLRKKLEERDEYYQNMMLQMASAPQQQQPAPGGQGQGEGAQGMNLDLDDLPDPVENPKEFKQALGKRMTEFQQQTSQQSQEQQQNQAQLANLENQFTTDYPDLSEKQMLFATAARAEADHWKSQGVEPSRVAFSQPKRFLKGVAKRMYDELGIDPDADNDEDEDFDEGEDRMRSRGGRRKAGGKQASGRTAGVSGGSRPSGGRKRQEGKKPPGYLDQIKKIQMDEGLL